MSDVLRSAPGVYVEEVSFGERAIQGAPTSITAFIVRAERGPVNEPVRGYAPGSPERASLKRRLDRMLGETVDVPLIIGGEEVVTGNKGTMVCPHDHGHVLGTFHQAGEKEIGATFGTDRLRVVDGQRGKVIDIDGRAKSRRFET